MKDGYSYRYNNGPGIWRKGVVISHNYALAPVAPECKYV